MKISSILLVVLLLINLFASYKLVRSNSFEFKQKVLQALLVWLLPFLGALIIILFIKDDNEPRGPDKQTFGGGTGGDPVI